MFDGRRSGNLLPQQLYCMLSCTMLCCCKTLHTAECRLQILLCASRYADIIRVRTSTLQQLLGARSQVVSLLHVVRG